MNETRESPIVTMLLAGVLIGVAVGLLIGTAAYVASPIDAIPDFVPIAGQADDLIVAGGSAVVLSGLYQMLKNTGALEILKELLKEGDE